MRFEDLKVFIEARGLVNRVYELTRSGPFSKDYSLVDQVRRAAVSILANIAEGFERGTSKELIQFLFVSKGSCGEVRALACISLDQGYISKNDYQEINDRCLKLSIMVWHLIQHRQRSTLIGPKRGPS